MASEHGAAPRAPRDNVSARGRLVSTDAANPREYLLDRPTISVGSHRSNDIVLGDGTVSRRHAQFTRVAGRFNLADLGSTNGTFVNGRRIRNPVALNAGDEIRFGSIKFAFAIASGSSSATPRSKIRRAGIVAMLAIVFAAGILGLIYRNEVLQTARSLGSKTSPTPPIAPSSEPAENPETAVAQPEPTSVPLADQPAWLARLNYYRAMLNLAPVAEDPKLSAGDRAHAKYIVKNYADAIQHAGLGAEMHEEDPHNKWFTSAGLEAAQASDMEADYIPGGARESDPSGSADPSGWAKERAPGTPVWTIDGWMAIPFHRMPMLNPRLARAGFGTYCEAGACAAGLNLKDGTREHLPPNVTIKWPLAFPPDGSTIQMESFGNEWPDPRSSCSGYEPPSGLAITLQMGEFRDARLGEFSVTQENADGSRVALEACGFDSQSYTNPDTAVQQIGRDILNNYAAVVVIPRRPLLKGGKYNVSITADAKPYSWSFSIAP
ncbi:MAG: FHA domain-containing protein [Candidatus Binatus sp.]|uniref:FHA domain-containing protein n=1 Tax=Candidatus Binatus sp. TaxID=2811406 RepID=UPI002715AA42|nr:FHA domain-containing protein [Candidatus Binatus sp.]MDO8433062.1 FHA domain-containing protein [Candidatus Binatus sp.]